MPPCSEMRGPSLTLVRGWHIGGIPQFRPGSEHRAEPPRSGQSPADASARRRTETVRRDRGARRAQWRPPQGRPLQLPVIGLPYAERRVGGYGSPPGHRTARPAAVLNRIQPTRHIGAAAQRPTLASGARPHSTGRLALRHREKPVSLVRGVRIFAARAAQSRGRIRPRSRAQVAIWVRDVSPSLLRMCSTWVSAVRSAITSAAAI